MDGLILAGLIAAAAVMEFVDSGLGMGYGTVLTPLLMAFGYTPIEVVPAVLLSQAVGGFIAAVFHQRQKNVDFLPKTTDGAEIKQGFRDGGLRGMLRRVLTTDMKIVVAIILLGVVAAMAGSVVAVHVPKWFLNGYIGVMVTGIGVLLLVGKTFTFSWAKLMAVGFFASFNKGFSGGGFGPIATGGQIVIGGEHRGSIGRTTLAEAPICIIAFLTYLAQKGVSDWRLIGALAAGAAVGAVFGAFLTRALNARIMKPVLGVIILALGIKVLWALLA